MLTLSVTLFVIIIIQTLSSASEPIDNESCNRSTDCVLAGNPPRVDHRLATPLPALVCCKRNNQRLLLLLHVHKRDSFDDLFLFFPPGSTFWLFALPLILEPHTTQFSSPPRPSTERENGPIHNTWLIKMNAKKTMGKKNKSTNTKEGEI